MLFYAPFRRMVFGRCCKSPFCGSFVVGLYFYELAALGDPGRLMKYDKWWNLLINGLYR
jgi:hypothetical protein